MQAFDLKRMVLDEFPLEFLGEVVLRCVFTFIMVFIFLKMTGRRGVRQMSLFEVVIILTLGSAAGDVAFYEDVPMLPIVVVFFSVMALYRLSTLLMNRSDRMQNWLEGKPLVIIRDGVFDWDTMQKANITHDEFFMELRQERVEHLGQVRLAILEVNGAISVYFFEKERVKPGLPVMPADYVDMFEKADDNADYACSICSVIRTLQRGERCTCSRCGNTHWVRAFTNSPVT
ncbi:DUF421 domain-containing protein [Edaphovirga cremea]|uniref:DUF421 domain-containing protein n=1 Tax=Edaphovirga cremea TaxID=2267246 RepID=UPI000DF0000B|nr:DUF421 domain-containing protein [Edaphovirga cremea]